LDAVGGAADVTHVFAGQCAAKRMLRRAGCGPPFAGMNRVECDACSRHFFLDKASYFQVQKNHRRLSAS
jgi:hypothetical protein